MDIKKKNIPLMPINDVDEKAYSSFKYNGKHPVVHEYVSDHPSSSEAERRKKKHGIPNKSDPYATISNDVLDTKDPEKESSGKLDKRFELYPKWFSNKVPSIFGKSFSKNYYYPFGGNTNKIVRSRDNIARISNVATTKKSKAHELPMSWLEPNHRQKIHSPASHFTRQLVVQPFHSRSNRIPYQFVPRAERLTYGSTGRHVRLGNAVGEVVDIPDVMLPPHRYVIKNVPYGLMQRINPNIYQPMHVVGQDGPGMIWTDYSSLRPGHRHFHQMNPCHYHPCLNHGHCHFSHRPETGYYHFKCACNKGFQGHYCEVSPYSCHPNPCRHGGTCTKTKSLVFCSCLGDYKGPHCEIEKSCLENPCFNDGICHDTSTSFYCECKQGWRGKSCEERVLLCESKPCKNGGICHDLEEDGQFECSCPTGFGCIDCSCPIDGLLPSTLITDQHSINHVINAQGEHVIASTNSVATMSRDVCPLSFCHNGGTCIKGPRGFLCNCATGFHGLFCDVPDLCTPNPCQNNGVCLQDGDENYKCICPYGFKGADCQLQLSCTGHPCMNGGRCVETADSYKCKCSTGYKGIKCTELSPCSHNPCLHKGVCFEKGTMYTCQCKKGYRGRTCQEKDPCFPNPCGANGQCLERSGNTICKCQDGWIGELCAVEDLCHQDSHCLNGGTCVHHLSEFKCICPNGFNGDNCELRQPCFGNPCDNGGVCEEAGESFVCKCLNGYHGEKCHLESHCYPSPCTNEGVCYESQTTFVCECKHGFAGKLCQDPKFCLSNPCLNGGHCTEIDDVFRCRCPLGFYGKVCDINVCDHNPCRNGGTCMPSSNEVGYTCECVFPYHGRQCDEMDTCAPNPCRHGGTCQSHLQHIQDVSFHEGPQFHGTDESVVSIVGPIYNETIHREPIYNTHEHRLEYVPDVHVVSNEVHHFHMTSDEPDHVYSDEIYNAKNVQTYHGDHDYLGGHHHQLFPNHHLTDDIAAGGHTVEVVNDINKREHVSKVDVHSNKTKRQSITRPLHEGSSKKVLKRNELLMSIDHVPQVMIKIRDNRTSKIIKRTMHDLYVCQCRPGYLGAHCQHLNPCETNPCHNDGVCVPRGELYQCKCVNGFGGANCDNPHPCLPNPCLHAGKCLFARNVNGYLCECGMEWRGQNCQNRDLCSLHNPCLHGGVCVNAEEDDKVICKCRARFTGDRCEVDKCGDCDVNAYCHHGSCLCKPDFVGNGYKCRAIGDICDPNPCENGGACRHGIDGSLFSCDCPHGFLGLRCELPNPCAIAPCLHNGACIDESSSKEKGILMADRHDYKCFCTPGYRGKNCEETNLAACSSGPCRNNGFCFDASSETHRRHLVHADDYECFCPPGFSGKDCEYEHYPCVSSPCMNGGHCLDAQKLPAVSFDAHGYKCSCSHGFAGRNCEVTVQGLGACHSNPCMHDGRCVDIINNNDPDLHFDYDHEFKCFCSALYSGILCEVPYPACHSQPCQHNGTCSDKTNNNDILYDETGYECKCSPGFEGKNCERQYALNVLDDNHFDRAFSEAAVFDHLHPGHPDRDPDITDNVVIENGGRSFNPNHKSSHLRLTDNLEDEDPFQGAQVTHVMHDKKPEPITFAFSEPKLNEKSHLETVDHKLDQAHGKIYENTEHSIPPTPATQIVDSFIHHPRLSTGQKFEFPVRNPSPTSPIVLSANLIEEPSFDSETKLAASQNRQKEIAGNARSDILVRNNVKRVNSNWNQVNVKKDIRVFYGAHGRRSAIAKKK